MRNRYFKIKMSDNSLKQITSSVCKWSMYENKYADVIIWSRPDLIDIGKVAIYKMIRDDGFEIVKFDKELISIGKKGAIYASIVFVITLILIYILNTDEKQFWHRYWLKQEIRRKKKV